MTRTIRRSFWQDAKSRVQVENDCRAWQPRYGIRSWDVEEYIVESLSSYDKSTRDGRERDVGARRAYKDGTNKRIRATTREKLKKVVDNVEEYDYMVFNDKYDSKFLAWMIW